MARRKPKRTIEDYNLFLESISSALRIIDMEKDYILFNNGLLLNTEIDVRTFRRRTRIPTIEFLDRIDLIYSTDVQTATEASREARRLQLSRANKMLWEKRGDDLRRKMKGRIPHNKGKKGLPGHPHSKETKAKLSAANSGPKNGMYGRRMSDEEKKQHSVLLRTKILAGEYTPRSNNKNTHWDSMYNNERFRSSWEAIYKYHNPNAEYEKLRVVYEIYGKQKVYIVDFIDTTSKIVIEVKPKETCNGEIFERKMKALEQWAIDNEYRVVLVDQEWLLNAGEPTDYSLFDERTSKKIKAFYEINTKKRNKQAGNNI